MDNNTRYAAHCAYVINYHLVWIPRYRKPILMGDIKARLKQLGEIARQYGFEVLACEVMPDHVHPSTTLRAGLFVSAPPKFSPANIVRLFKGVTSRRLKQEFPQIRRTYCGKNALWAEGYYVGTASHVSAETIKRYIEECQKD